MRNYDREWDELERALSEAIDAGDLKEAEYIRREMRELRAEAAEHERWEDQGHAEGWLQ